VQSFVINNLVQTIMTQHYENNSKDEILTTFLFPIDADLVISKVRAKFGEVEIET